MLTRPSRPPFSPEPSSSRTDTRHSALRAATPPPTGMTQRESAWANPTPDIQAAIPAGLHEQLIKKLSQNTKLGQVLKTVFRSKASSSTKTGPIQTATRALSRATIEMLGTLPDVGHLQQHAIRLAQRENTSTSRVDQYITKAAPDAVKWLSKHHHIFQHLPVHIEERINDWKAICTQRNMPWHATKKQLNLKDTIAGAIVTSNPLLREHQATISALVEHLLDKPDASHLEFITQEKEHLTIRSEDLLARGAQWIDEFFPKLASNIERDIESAIETLLDQNQTQGKDWGESLRDQHMVAQLTEHFIVTAPEGLGKTCPAFIQQLVQRKLEAPKNYRVYYTTQSKSTLVIDEPILNKQTIAWRKQHFQDAAKQLETEIQNHVLDWHLKHFNTSSLPMADTLLEEKAQALQAQFSNSHPFAKQFPTLLYGIVRNTILSPPPYQLYYNNPKLKNTPSPQMLPNSAFLGGYFKAHKKSQTPRLTATRVRAASGQVYELINQLTPEIRQQLIAQHLMTPTENKLILGQGGYGKVRLARRLDNGEFVAVKKFIMKNSAPKVYAEKEINQFNAIKNAEQDHPASTSNTLLDSMLDFAHVFVPSTVGSNPKSYLFTPLANLGDGEEAGKSIQALRRVGKNKQADQRFLHIATLYTAAVQELHSKGLHHRDIKPKNFLHTQTTEGETIRLSDFGVMLDKRWENDFHGGTERYFPPEMRGRGRGRGTQYHAEKHDAFSLGLSLLELQQEGGTPQHRKQMHLKLRYADGSTQVVQLNFDESSRCEGVPDHLLKNLANDHVDNVIAQLLAHSPDSRISAAVAHQQFDKASK